MIWWDVKSSNANTMAPLEMPKSLVLRWGKFPLVGQDGSAIAKAVKSNRAKERGRNNFSNYASQFQAAFVRSQIPNTLK